MSIEVKYYQPEDKLKWLVIQFETIRSDGTQILRDIFVPRPDASLVFHFGLPPKLIKPMETRLPEVFISPVTSKSIGIEVNNKLSSFIVTCKPTILSRLLKINMSQRDTMHFPVELPCIQELYYQIKDLKSTAERIEFFSRFLNQFHPEAYSPDETDNIFEKIISQSFSVPVTEILNSSSMNQRTLRRKFMKRVGVCPKTLARIVRLNHLMDRIKNPASIDFQEMIFEGGYYDQAHFIKDFKSIIGEVPHHFFQRNLEMVKIISGKNNIP